MGARGSDRGGVNLVRFLRRVLLCKSWFCLGGQPIFRARVRSAGAASAAATATPSPPALRARFT